MLLDGHLGLSLIQFVQNFKKAPQIICPFSKDDFIYRLASGGARAVFNIEALIQSTRGVV